MDKPTEAEPTSHLDEQEQHSENPSEHDQNKETVSEDEPVPDSSIKENGGMPPEEEEFITGFKLILVLFSITITCFLALLDTSIIGTAIPSITTDFHSLADVGWYGASYLLATSSLQPLAGKFYTYFKSKWMFMVFVCVFEVGSFICGIAPNSNALIIGRAVAGLGTAGIVNGATTIIAHCVPLPKRPLMMGIMFSFAQIGVLCGPLIGGAFTQNVTWRWCFYINLPAGALVLIFLFFISIPDKSIKDANRRWNLRTIFKLLDIVGFCLFAPAAVMFLLAIEWGGVSYPWNSATIIGLFCGSGATLAIFLVWEYRKGDNAMIPFSIMGKLPVWTSCLFLFFFMGSMLTQSYYLPIYFQTIKGVTPILSGVYLLPSILSQIIFSVVSGAGVGRLGYALPWAAACGVLAPVAAGLMGTLTPTSSTGMWIGYQIIAGAGRGLGIQMPMVQVQNYLSAEQVSLGISLAVFSQTFGGSLFLSFGQTVFTAGLKEAFPIYAPNANLALVIAAGASGVQSVVSAADLPGVLVAYNQALQHVFYLSAGAAASTFVVCWGMGWKDIRKSKTVTPEA